MARQLRTSTDWNHRPRLRFYCPVCGEVRGQSRWSDNTSEHNGKLVRQGDLVIPTGTLVYPHFRPFFLGSDKCPGGKIDPVKDRAP